MNKCYLKRELLKGTHFLLVLPSRQVDLVTAGQVNILKVHFSLIYIIPFFVHYELRRCNF